jgi:hypothetical protein
MDFQEFRKTKGFRADHLNLTDKKHTSLERHPANGFPWLPDAAEESRQQRRSRQKAATKCRHPAPQRLIW